MRFCVIILFMIKKVIRKIKLNDPSNKNFDFLYWSSMPAEKRIVAVEILRRQYHGDTEGLQRVIRIVKQK